MVEWDNRLVEKPHKFKLKWWQWLLIIGVIGRLLFAIINACGVG